MKGADPPANVGVVEFRARVGANGVYEALSAGVIGDPLGATFDHYSAPVGLVTNDA